MRFIGETLPSWYERSCRFVLDAAKVLGAHFQKARRVLNFCFGVVYAGVGPSFARSNLLSRGNGGPVVARQGETGIRIANVSLAPNLPGIAYS